MSRAISLPCLRVARGIQFGELLICKILRSSSEALRKFQLQPSENEAEIPVQFVEEKSPRFSLPLIIFLSQVHSTMANSFVILVWRSRVAQSFFFLDESSRQRQAELDTFLLSLLAVCDDEAPEDGSRIPFDVDTFPL